MRLLDWKKGFRRHTTRSSNEGDLMKRIHLSVVSTPTAVIKNCNNKNVQNQFDFYRFSRKRIICLINIVYSTDKYTSEEAYKINCILK